MRWNGFMAGMPISAWRLAELELTDRFYKNNSYRYPKNGGYKVFYLIYGILF